MKINEYYKLIREIEYKKVGLDVDYQIIVSDEDKEVILSLRGTNSNTDRLIDIDFPAKVYKNQKSCIKAHRGFAKAWKSANDVIMNEFISECSKYENYIPLIIGHSLGGALAIFASEDFYFRTNKKAKMITFGCPNVLYGNESNEYVKSCIDNPKQYAQYNDIVTIIPLGYKQPNKIKVGKKFNLFKLLFGITNYHLGYGELNYAEYN